MDTVVSAASTTGLSVVVPARNEEKYIGQCLQSLLDLRKDNEDIELLLVDNGSTDSTVAIARSKGARVIIKQGGTISSVRNAGAAECTHSLIAFVDADCSVRPGWLESVFKQFEDETVVAAGCYPQPPESGVSWVHRTFVAIATQPPGPPGPTDWLPSANMVVRKRIFEQVGGFDEQMVTAEDADLSYRLAQLGTIVNNHDFVMTHYREPATLWQLFKKETWRGLGSFEGVVKGRWTVSELPSLIAPLVTISGLALIVLALLLFDYVPALLGAGLVLIVPVAYTLRAMMRRVPLSWGHKTFAVYVVYHLARAWSVFKWLGMRLSNQSSGIHHG